jgi:hypothetical protein
MSGPRSPSDDEDAIPDAPSAETKPSAMLPLERQIGFALTAFGAGLAAVSIAAGNDPLAPLAGLIATLGLGVAVWRAHRVIAMFAGLIVAFAVGFPVEVLFLGYSGFLMLRFNKAQAKRNASRPRQTAKQRQEAKAARRAGRGRATGAGPGPGKGASPSSVVRQPVPNRRYTPPKAKPVKRPIAPPAPTTSILDKKAAPASSKRGAAPSNPGPRPAPAPAGSKPGKKPSRAPSASKPDKRR